MYVSKELWEYGEIRKLGRQEGNRWCWVGHVAFLTWIWEGGYKAGNMKEGGIGKNVGEKQQILFENAIMEPSFL